MKYMIKDGWCRVRERGTSVWRYMLKDTEFLGGTPVWWARAETDMSVFGLPKETGWVEVRDPSDTRTTIMLKGIEEAVAFFGSRPQNPWEKGVITRVHGSKYDGVIPGVGREDDECIAVLNNGRVHFTPKEWQAKKFWREVPSGADWREFAHDELVKHKYESAWFYKHRELKLKLRGDAELRGRDIYLQGEIVANMQVTDDFRLMFHVRSNGVSWDLNAKSAYKSYSSTSAAHAAFRDACGDSPWEWR